MCTEMETEQHYCTAFVRYNNAPYQYKTGIEWTAPQDRYYTNMAECQTAWSLSPFFYSTGNHSCMCSRYKPFNSFGDSSTFSHDHNSSRNLEKPEEKRRDNTSSISKMLKFGIERILTDKNSLDNDADNAVKGDGNTNEVPNTESVSRSRRKNGTRSVFSHFQRNLLERHYERREYVTKGERYHIALEVGISEEQVKIWFQNRRTKKKKLEMSKACDKSPGVWLS